MVLFNHMARRVLAFYTTFCLLAAFFARPVLPTLVCRVTGQPMPLVVANPHNEGSCCAVAEQVDASGRSHYALTSPGCCDLHVPPDRAQSPAVASSAPDFGLLVAWVPARIAAPLPVAAVIASPPILFTQTAPRAPPVETVRGRGPPPFS